MKAGLAFVHQRHERELALLGGMLRRGVEQRANGVRVPVFHLDEESRVFRVGGGLVGATRKTRKAVAGACRRGRRPSARRLSRCFGGWTCVYSSASQ